MLVGLTISARPRQSLSRTIRRWSDFRRRHAASMVAFVIFVGSSLITCMVLSAAVPSDRTLTGHMTRRQAISCGTERKLEMAKSANSLTFIAMRVDLRKVAEVKPQHS